MVIHQVTMFHFFALLFVSKGDIFALCIIITSIQIRNPTLQLAIDPRGSL